MTTHAPVPLSSWLLRVLGGALLLGGMALGLGVEREVAARQDAPAGVRFAGPGDGERAQTGQADGSIRVAGLPQVAQPPLDDEFGQQVVTPVLVRRVEMFQWREVRAGDQVHYERDWLGHPVASAGFAKPEGHANPGRFPIESKQFDAGEVRLGRFVLSPELVHALPGSDPVTPDMRRVPGNLAASFGLYGNGLVSSADPARPRLGDLRVSWEAVPLRPVTVFARVAGDRLAPVPHADDGRGYRILVGEQMPEDMLPPAAARHTGRRRALAFVLAALGAWLAWYRSPRPGAGDLPLAIAVAVLALGTVGGVAWLGYDGRVAASGLAFAVLGLAAALWRLRARPA